MPSYAKENNDCQKPKTHSPMKNWISKIKIALDEAEALLNAVIVKSKITEGFPDLSQIKPHFVEI